MDAPNTLLEAFQYFADEDVALAFVADMRWPDGEQTCRKCGSIAKHYFMKTRKRWKCRDCRHQFSIKVGTIFEGSPLSLTLWLPAMWMLANCKNGISSYELGRALGVTQKTAWFMLHRIRLAMKDDGGFWTKMDGDVEVDETYIGGKAKNMRRARRKRIIKGTGGHDKTAVMGLLERPRNAPHSLVRTTVLDDVTQRTITGPCAGQRRGRCQPLHRQALGLLRALCRLHARDHRPRPRVRARSHPHQRDRKLLVPA